MSKKSHYIILVIVVLLVVVLLNLPNPMAGKLKLAIGGLFFPLFGLAASTHQTATHALESSTSRADLLSSNAVLRSNNFWLATRLREASNTFRENDKLHQMLKFQQSRPTWNLQLARVILRDPETWWRNIWIDVGRNTPGVRTNLPVLTDQGLIGKVVSVGETRSQVVLLGDPSLRVAVLVGTNHLNGTIMAQSRDSAHFDMVDLENIFGENTDLTVHAGDEVVTWGQGGVFPKGIPVGAVVDERKESGTTMEARVRLAASMDALENVWVMILP